MWLALAGPLLGLCGVITGLWLGERRWKRDAARDDTKLYRDKLVTTYFELWEIVNVTNEQMRQALSDGIDAHARAKLIANVNDFMLRAGIYIERQDRILVLDYLSCTHEYFNLLAGSGREDELFMSMPHDDLAQHVEGAIRAQGRADALRNALRERVQVIAKMNRSGGWDPGIKPSRELVAKLRGLRSEPEPH